MNNDKKLGLLFYSAGRFEGLKADAGSTIEFIQKDDGRILPSQKDISILRDMKAAWYAIDPTMAITPTTYQTAHGNMLASTHVAVPGGLRSRPVEVSFGGGERRWRAKHPVVSEALFTEKINEALANFERPKAELAARLFFNVAKLQPFPDGNKRTSILVANRLLLEKEQLMLVPYHDEDYKQFMTVLEGFYNDRISLDVVGRWYGKQVVDVNDLEISMPFGEIVEKHAATQYANKFEERVAQAELERKHGHDTDVNTGPQISRQQEGPRL
jgi:hypothetical protein